MERNSISLYRLVLRELALMCIGIFVLTSCRKENEEISTKSIRIAVIVPADKNTFDRYTDIADWFNENIMRAQENYDEKYKLTIEWYDEDSEDLNVVSKSLADRKDITAVVGPLRSSNVEIVANNLAQTQKMHIAPIASSADLVRGYAGKNFFWSLCETDITQSELLLTLAGESPYKDITLVASNSTYGKTFSDWMPFQALEMGMNLRDVITYEPGELQEYVQNVFKTKNQTIIFALNDYKELSIVQEEYNKCDDKYSINVLYTDIVDDPGIVDYPQSLLDGMIGISIVPDPNSGFEIAYKTRFPHSSTAGESQFYDALTMVLLGSIYKDINRETTSLYDATKEIVSTDGEDLLVWSYDGLRREIDAILNKSNLYNISGASSALDFDTKVQTNVTKSYYARWMYLYGDLNRINYYSSDGSFRTLPNLAAWNWDVKKTQNFNNNISLSYPEHKSNYALLIAASSEWYNYRHQADVLDMYNILKKNGWNDDHIILIVEDDIAYNASNPYPGVIKVKSTGENLYNSTIEIDYHLTDLQATDIQKILIGQKSETVQKVFNTTENDNILVFWSGHGRCKDNGKSGDLCWNFEQPKKSFNNEVFVNLLNAMQGKYRKMLWLIETCHSGAVAQYCESYPGVMCIAAANPLETSKCDVHDEVLGTWMSNRFTSTITECLYKNPSILFKDLYYEVSRQTIGSHVSIYNADNFDNLYTTGLYEFVEKR